MRSRAQQLGLGHLKARLDAACRTALSGGKLVLAGRCAVHPAPTGTHSRPLRVAWAPHRPRATFRSSGKAARLFPQHSVDPTCPWASPGHQLKGIELREEERRICSLFRLLERQN